MMAGKMPPGGQQPPPPPYQYHPPQPYQTNTVVVQGAPRTTVVHKPASGLFGSFMSSVNSVGNQLGKEVDYLGNKVNQAVDTSAQSPMLSLFQTGNVVQLVSRTTGKSLQIMMGANGLLVLNGNGPTGPGAFNTSWTVINEGNNQVRLHNNYNYLTVVNGYTTLVNMPAGAMHGIETKWQLSLMQNFVLLESMKERGRHVGILPNGQLKPALACGRELNAEFGVSLLSTPYPQGATAQVTQVTQVTVVKK